MLVLVVIVVAARIVDSEVSHLLSSSLLAFTASGLSCHILGDMYMAWDSDTHPVVVAVCLHIVHCTVPVRLCVRPGPATTQDAGYMSPATSALAG